MPELPEVETVLQGIKPFVENQYIRNIIIRERRLRWHIPTAISQLINQKIIKVERRGKYLLFNTHYGAAILHFGMSGSLSLLHTQRPPLKHDHFDILFDTFYLRYNDPRRFGALLFTQGDPFTHPLIAHLGVEPFDIQFTGDYLFTCARNKTITVKQFIMNSAIVVGVGNIYATESLFFAGLNPLKATKTLSIKECERLTSSIREVLQAAIYQGGTTLRDFTNSHGKPGYFKQELSAYGRGSLPCKRCGTKLVSIRIQNRATVYCPACQPF